MLLKLLIPELFIAWKEVLANVDSINDLIDQLDGIDQRLKLAVFEWLLEKHGYTWEQIREYMKTGDGTLFLDKLLSRYDVASEE